MKPVDFHPAAQAELDAAAAYYEGRLPGLGQGLLAEAAASVAKIQAHPQRFPMSTVGKGRECPLRRFPYSIIYRELPHRIWVAAVAHHKRKQGYWARRRP